MTALTLTESLTRLLFIAAVLALGWAGRPHLSTTAFTDARPKWFENLRHLRHLRTKPPATIPWIAPATLIGGLITAALYALTGDTLAAWALTLALWAAALWLAELLADGLPWPLAAAVIACCAGLVGGAVVVLEQLEGGFAEEEFFSALAALVLASGWALTLLAHRVIRRYCPPPPHGLRLGVRRRWLALAALLAVAVAGWGTLRAYQASFFPVPPPFEGISAEQPTLCEQLAPPASTYTGVAVFAQLLALVEAHPQKGVPEYGMLALGTGEQPWAARFREAILAEAAAAAFSGPANSVKYGQFEAAKRAYYYDKVRAAFPALFSAEDDEALRAWFAAVNRHALTVEWVDWLYALAFGERPSGPYVNQETGAGLLAVLETTGLADPALAEQNRAYLAGAERGWLARWRNSDDTYYYQSEWITNALYQSLASGAPPPAQARRSFEWLLLQLPPDGRPLRYNFPLALSPEASFYLGASLLNEPRYLWAAALAAGSPARAYNFSAAQPGADAALSMRGTPPSEGSCLLYGDTGTPTLPGALGPDKLVFRENWQPDGAYMLLNLRFTGWHRYKASNTLSLIVQGSALVEDQLDGSTFSWLPRGRSAFRDKRIPRENLSGLVVGRSGMSAVRQMLSGLGGPWAQDPPPFARVERFAPGPRCDLSVTALDGWRGWDQRRTIRFCPGEPTVIADEATGPIGAQAAIMWNLAEPATLVGNRVRLSPQAELVLLPLDGTTIAGDRPTPTGVERLAVIGAGPRLRSVAVLLTGPWLGADVTLTDEAPFPHLRISSSTQTIELEPFGSD